MKVLYSIIIIKKKEQVYY